MGRISELFLISDSVSVCYSDVGKDQWLLFGCLLSLSGEGRFSDFFMSDPGAVRGGSGKFCFDF